MDYSADYSIRSNRYRKRSHVEVGDCGCCVGVGVPAVGVGISLEAY